MSHREPFPIHLLFLLVDVCWPVPTSSEGTRLMGCFPHVLYSPLHPDDTRTRVNLGRPIAVVIWDTQTGVVINGIPFSRTRQDSVRWEPKDNYSPHARHLLRI
jgi:hypothetical protein